MKVDVKAWSALDAMYQYDGSANAICSPDEGGGGGGWGHSVSQISHKR